MARPQLLYTDPPWKYGSRSVHTKTKFGGGVSQSYDLMTDTEIRALGPLVQAVAAPASVLLMWAVMPKLDIALDVMKAWGYKFSTVAFVWVKTYASGQPFIGPGFWTASNAEVVLLGWRGKTIERKKRLVNQIVLEPHPRENGKIIHSRKPETVRQRIEDVFGDVPRLEMFARLQSPGWTALGNGLTGRDIRDDLRALAEFEQPSLFDAIPEATA
jgi:site-specific DNA-methyltransferase (adenine-specific)